MKLIEFEAQSALWLKIEKELTDRLVTLRGQNDGDRSTEETAKLRGRIAEVKSILEWAKPDPKIDSD